MVPRATTAHPNAVYLCSIGGGALAGTSIAEVCSKSLDGGNTFAPTGAPAFGHIPPGAVGGCFSGNGHEFVGADGTLYLPRGHCGQPWLAISQAEGATWKRVRGADNGMPQNKVIVDHEAAVAADERGNIYYSAATRDRYHDRP